MHKKRIGRMQISPENIGTPVLVRFGTEKYFGQYPGVIGHRLGNKEALLAFVVKGGWCLTTLEQRLENTQPADIIEKVGGLELLRCGSNPTVLQFGTTEEMSLYSQIKEHSEAYARQGYNLADYLRY